MRKQTCRPLSNMMFLKGNLGVNTQIQMCCLQLVYKKLPPKEAVPRGPEAFKLHSYLLENDLWWRQDTLLGDQIWVL